MQITDEMVEKMCLLLWHELPGFMFGAEQHGLMRQLLVSAGQLGGALATPAASNTVPVRVAVAMTPMPNRGNAFESRVLVAFDDGTFWEVGVEKGGWYQIAGPSAPIPTVPEVVALVGEARKCGCDNGQTCHWPNCEKTGSGIGHHP